MAPVGTERSRLTRQPLAVFITFDHRTSEHGLIIRARVEFCGYTTLSASSQRTVILPHTGAWPRPSPTVGQGARPPPLLLLRVTAEGRWANAWG